MNPLVAEWIEKAEGDFDTALREYRARKRPNYDSACFHSQQCIEKYLKAILQAENIPFSKTHDLGVLLDSCIPLNSLWEAYRPDLEALSEYAVAFRYPGMFADRNKAKWAVSLVKNLRKEFRSTLKIEQP